MSVEKSFSPRKKAHAESEDFFRIRDPTFNPKINSQNPNPKIWKKS